MSRFFIDRPVFAWVLAIILMLFGLVALATLPIAQYPSIAPPAVSVTVVYPGASAETAQTTVVQVIEQQLSGIDHLLYFSSSSDKSGAISITLSFAQGTDPDIAQVQVQNKLQLAEPRLPAIVQEQGITVAKATKNFLMVLGFVSTDGALSTADIGDFLASNVQDPISRTAGVGTNQLFGSQYAMRIWLDPSKLNDYGLTPADVSAAIQAQNVQVSAGELGGLPAVPGQELDATIIGPSYLQLPEQFGRILVRVTQTGAQVRVSDVGRVELGAESFTSSSKFNGHNAAAVAVSLASGANALDTVAAIKQTIERLRPNFPPGLDVIYPYDTTPFVRLSIHNVVETLAVAVLLVFLIMFLFLQNWRATLIPTIAVPVVLLGTCGVLLGLGYSINSLTMFGMVLAIGLLVDDAIVVVENVERVMEEDHLSPREATRKSMDEISGALIGIAMVLTAVFLPLAFFSGSTGVIYRQFSITIVASMLLSVTVALLFTPALCATILRPPKRGAGRQRGPFGVFNRGFDRLNRSYLRGVHGAIARPVASLVVFAGIVVVLVVLFLRIPAGFLPDEDQGVMFVQVSAPPGATASRTQKVLDDAYNYLKTNEAANISGVFEVNGFSFAGAGQNVGLMFIQLTDWDKRPGARNTVQAIAGRAQKYFFSIKDALVFAFAPPAVLELGNATGFDFELQDRGNLGHAALIAAPQPAARHDEDRPAPAAGAPQRRGRRAAIPHRDRPRESQRARPEPGRHQHHHVGRLGLRLRQRLYRPRPRQARLHPGRCALAHAAVRPRQLVRAQPVRPDGKVLQLRPRRLGHRLAKARALQRRALRRAAGRAGAGAEHGHRYPGDGGAGGQAAAGLRPRMDRAVLRGGGVRLADHPALRRSDDRGVPVPGRPLRELGDPGGGDAGGAAGRGGRGARHLAARAGQRRVLSGRAADDDRAVVEERHPDRGIRQGQLRFRQVAGGRGRRPRRASDCGRS